MQCLSLSILVILLNTILLFHMLCSIILSAVCVIHKCCDVLFNMHLQYNPSCFMTDPHLAPPVMQVWLDPSLRKPAVFVLRHL
jgi:hypothetical protein